MKTTKLVSTILFLMLLGCSPYHRQEMAESNTKSIKSIFGIYITNTEDDIWLTIFKQGHYQICSTTSCEMGEYSKVPVEYGVILHDFYLKPLSLKLEAKSHGPEVTAEFVAQMREIRRKEIRANDLPFSVHYCGDIPCAEFGHSRSGLRFYQIKAFN